MGEAPSRTLLGTPHYQVGSDGGSSTADSSSKLAYMDAFVMRSRMLWEPEIFNWHTRMLSLFDREWRSVETKPGRQKGSSRIKYHDFNHMYIRVLNLQQWNRDNRENC